MGQYPLAEFLQARIAELEKQAIDAFGYLADTRMEAPYRRTLADCEAKRRIVNRYLHEAERYDELYQAGDPTTLDMRDEYEKHILPALAMPYADHPDYRESWRLPS